MRPPRLLASALLAAVLLAGCAPGPAAQDAAQEPALRPSLRLQTSGTSVLLVAADAVDDRTAWVSGAGGTVLRTLDGGATWEDVSVPGADTLQFRDVEAFGPDTAYVLSIGGGAASRIYKTTDGGQDWTLQFQNAEASAFYDCMAFWDTQSGIAFSDSHDGAFPVLTTSDGGQAWARVPASALPAANDGEGSFAASGTCIATTGERGAVFITGASGQAPRAFRTADRGATWAVSTVPVVGAGEAAGLASVAFVDASHGYAAGGDLAGPDTAHVRVARTADGGATWAPAAAALPLPVVYGLAVVPGSSPTAPRLVATGPGGVAYSADGGQAWEELADEATWGLSFADARGGWLVGPGGRIVRVTFR